MSLETLIFTYVVLTLGAVTVVGIYYERRRRLFTQSASEDSIFRCEKCHYVYTDDADVDRSRCPHCGKVNDAFQF